MIFLLGPGGVGKSTLGRELAKRLSWPHIDLDLEFCESFGEIGGFIGTHGYERYRAENLDLAFSLTASIDRPTLFVTSSGFLAARAGTRDYAQARQLVSTGYGLVLLPSLDIEIATPLVVARQLSRGFGLERATEDRKFRERFDIYRREGDVLVVSMEPPDQIASAVEQAIHQKT
ncbi:shikimate kinase [Devosia nitrariae]|uniref:shikimate kinase n=1 Tax=Devosia nitrariae TaxID=2071872 RepID=UPI0024E0B517|nr:shikimate kinase [Devosia nitrariae]